MIDRRTDVIPVQDMTAETIAQTIIFHRISWFGIPAKIPTEFECALLKHLTKHIGIRHIKTSVYHPAANGKIDSWHHSINAALKLQMTDNWFSKFTTVPLVLQSYIIPEFNTTSAKWTYGEPICLPADFFADHHHESNDIPEILYNLKEHVENKNQFLIKHQ